MDYLKTTVKKVLRFGAILVLVKYKPKIIAITGSVGKSLTKEAIYAVIAKKVHVRKTEKSFTTELGVPLAIIGSPYGMKTLFDLFQAMLFALKIICVRTPYPEWLVLELDADKPGDLHSVSWLPIDVLVITAIGEVPSHVEFFGNLDNFLEEKRALFTSMKRSGVIVYNADDIISSKLAKESEMKLLSCGVGGGADYSTLTPVILYGKNGELSVPDGMSFEISSSVNRYPMQVMKSLGIQNQYACMLACAVGEQIGLAKEVIAKNLTKYSALPGRMNIIQGIKGATIIDDSYNSSPIAMSQALSVFSDVETIGRKIVVVGDMLELGKFSFEEHKKVAHEIRNIADIVFCVGLRTRKITEELLSLGFLESNIFSYDDSLEVGKDLQNMLQEGDLVLVKGSQAMRMEKVVEEIMNSPKDARKILVRQEEEWVGRNE